MTAIEYLDRPPSGWFALNVARVEKRKWDWAALMVDMHPDELKQLPVQDRVSLHPPGRVSAGWKPQSARSMGPRSPASTGTQMPLGTHFRT